MQILGNIHFTGTQINYYFVCQRKLWFFSKQIEMEKSSGLVLLGKILHNDSYPRQKKEYLIDGNIVIDFVKNEVIHEIKRSNKMEQAHIFQMLYYLYYLKGKGLEKLKGVINYPLLRNKVNVELTNDKEKELEEVLRNIQKILEHDNPPKLKKMRHCRSCSYYELCWV